MNTTLPLQDEAAVQTALDEAFAARAALAAEPTVTRAERLNRVADAIEDEADAFAALIVDEVRKPIRYARGEVARAVVTFRLAAETARAMRSEPLRIGETGGQACDALLRRVPIGLCSLISPFNFPLNLVAHKVAPAVAAGCPWVLKPARQGTGTARKLHDLLLAEGQPPGSCAVVHAPPSACGPLTDDPRVRHLSFTGSGAVGWALKRRAARATVTLELGGMAPAIVGDDWQLEDALDRCVVGAFAYSGQICISTQRILVPKASFEAAAEGMAARASALVRGDLHDDATEIGPVIETAAASRIEAWLEEALAAGATLHAGGRRDGDFIEPTVLSGTPSTCKLGCDEVFGPVVVVEPYDDWDRALEAANATPFGLQAAIFTRDEARIGAAHDRLEFGQVVVGDGTVFRTDDMPYGGVKGSGVGREGVAWAVEEMTEPRLLIRR